MVMFIGPYSCFLWRMCISDDDWGFFFGSDISYFLCIFFLDVTQFDLCKGGDRSGIGIVRCHYAFMCWYCTIFSSFEYIINCIICAECDLNFSILVNFCNFSHHWIVLREIYPLFLAGRCIIV